jgi:hypothetical protein
MQAPAREADEGGVAFFVNDGDELSTSRELQRNPRMPPPRYREIQATLALHINGVPMPCVYISEEAVKTHCVRLPRSTRYSLQASQPSAYSCVPHCV